MTMNKKKAARRRGDAGYRFSVARVPALLAAALGAIALPAWAQDAGQAGDTAQTQDETVQLPQVRVCLYIYLINASAFFSPYSLLIKSTFSSNLLVSS